MALARSISCVSIMIALLGGCARPAELPSVVDRLMFHKAGGTVFSTPDPLTMKEIHLDNGTLTGRQVIIEGRVMEISENFTYLVLSDETARMLVVLTDIEDARPWLKDQKPTTVKILGTVENGKKGLPYIMARALNAVVQPMKS